MSESAEPTDRNERRAERRRRLRAWRDRPPTELERFLFTIAGAVIGGVVVALATLGISGAPGWVEWLAILIGVIVGAVIARRFPIVVGIALEFFFLSLLIVFELFVAAVAAIGVALSSFS